MTRKLVTIAALKEAQMTRWLEEQSAALDNPELRKAVLRATGKSPEDIRSLLSTLASQNGLEDLALVGPQGRVEWAGMLPGRIPLCFCPLTPTPLPFKRL